MEERLITRLDECLAAIAAGESIESCLARYPDDADELAALLQMALALEELPGPGPSPATTLAAKTRFMNQAAARQSPKRVGPFGVFSIALAWAHVLRRLPVPRWPTPLRTLATAAMTVVLVLVIGGGVLHAASGSLPGDPLYGFKLLGEDLQRAFTLSHSNRTVLEEAFTARRQGEVRRLLALGRQEKVVFGGLMREQSEDQWLVADIPVMVGADTRRQNEVAARAYVEIHGVTQFDGTVKALLIETEGDEIIGRLEQISPDFWQVAGHQIQVDGKTSLEVQPGIGDCVRAQVRRFPNGTLRALTVERAEECPGGAAADKPPTPTASGTPTASPSPTLTATRTAAPTATPEPSVTSPPSFVPEEDDDDEAEVAPPGEPDEDDKDGSDGDGDSEDDGGQDEGSGGDGEHDGDDGGGDDGDGDNGQDEDGGGDGEQDGDDGGGDDGDGDDGQDEGGGGDRDHDGDDSGGGDDGGDDSGQDDGSDKGNGDEGDGGDDGSGEDDEKDGDGDGSGDDSEDEGANESKDEEEKGG
jgi:hypothetical protein